MSAGRPTRLLDARADVRLGHVLVGPTEHEALARSVGVQDGVLVAAVEERERVVLGDLDVEVLEELDLGGPLLHVHEQLDDVRLLLGALEK
jgi:hypothetical protein